MTGYDATMAASDCSFPQYTGEITISYLGSNGQILETLMVNSKHSQFSGIADDFVSSGPLLELFEHHFEDFCRITQSL